VVDEVLDRVGGVLGIARLDPDAIGSVLGTTFRSRPTSNRYYDFYEAEPVGPWVSIRLKTPRAAATGPAILTLDLCPGTLAEAEVAAVYGPGTISQIIPEAGEDGSVTMQYITASPFEFFCRFTAAGRQLESLTIRAG
jgi:hypothetical protein